MKKTVLIVAMIMMIMSFPVIHMSAQAQDDSRYFEALRLLEALKVNSFSVPDDIVTYRSFNEALYIVLNGDANFGSITNMSGISYSKEKGMTPITYADAVKCLVNIAGYNVIEEVAGGTSLSRIVTLNNKILDGVEIETGESVNARDAAIMIYNTFNVDMLQVIKYGKRIDYKIFDGETVLYRYRRIRKAEGVVKANEYTSLINEDGSPKGSVNIDNVLFKDDKEIAVDFIGQTIVYYYYENDDGMSELLLAYQDENCNDITIIDGNFASNSGRRVYYYNDNDRVIYKDIPGTAAVIYNGVAITVYDNSIFDFTNKQAELIDYNDDNVIDVVKIKEYSDWLVGEINTSLKILYDEVSGRKLDLDNSDISRVRFFDADGGDSGFYFLKEGDLLTVYESQNGKVYDIYVSESQVIGTIEGLTNINNILYISVADNEYQVSNNFRNSDENNLVIGKTATFYINSRGEIAYAKYSDSSMEYGYIIDMLLEEKISTVVKVFLLTAENEMECFTLKKNVKIDGEAYKKADQALAALYGAKIIRYSATENKEISVIDTEKISEKETDENMSSFGDYQDLTYVATGYVFDNEFKANTDTIIFFCPTDANKQSYDNFAVTDVTFLVSGFVYTAQAFSSSPTNYIAEAVVIDASVKDYQKVNERSHTYVFVDGRFVLDEEGEKACKINVYEKVTEKTFFCIPELAEEVSGLDKGDVINLEFNEEGRICDIVEVYDAQTNTLLSTEEIDGFAGKTKAARCRMISGYVYYNGDNTVGISNVDPALGVIPGKGELEYVRLSDNMGTIVDSNYNKKDIRHIRRATVAEIKDFMKYNECAQIFIRIEQRGTNCFVVYQ